jgi:membrane fusion protein (multidrug efflux system)
MYFYEIQHCGCGKRFGIGSDGERIPELTESRMTQTLNVRERAIVCVCTSAAAIAFSLVGCSSESTSIAPQPVNAEQRASSSPLPSAAIDSNSKADPLRYTTVGPLVVDHQADIAAGRDGRVLRILVDIGQEVRAGEVLAVLDDKMQAAEVASKRARVDSLTAQVKEWEAEEKSVDADLRRAEKMRDDKIISEENWEHAKYKLEETHAEVARFQADVKAAFADLQSVEEQLSLSEIRAPFAGVIGRRSVREAQELKRGDVLFWLTAREPLHIVFTVPETAMAGFVAGAPLELTTAAFPSIHQAARILRVSPVVDPASGSIQVVGVVESPSHSLVPGMSMQVRLAR